MRPLCLLVRRSIPLKSKCMQRRQLLTLAIETSCDDTSVAVLEKHENNTATLHFHEKITSDNRAYGGVHPLAAHESHQKNLANLVNKSLRTLPYRSGYPSLKTSLVLDDENTGRIRRGSKETRTRRKPDFITVTRGPGMRASLFTGLDTAKGLAVAWQIPLLGVNHMQAHALTPQLVSALDATEHLGKDADAVRVNHPYFPFLTLLVSGGHTMLVHSKSLCDHEILANTTDIAVGDMIDKTAREVVPASVVESSADVMYGKLLESYAFPDENPAYNYTPPSSFNRPRKSTGSEYTWEIHPPYSNPGAGGSIAYANAFSFSGIGSALKSIIDRYPEMDHTGRRLLARETMTLAFEHLASRVISALNLPEIRDIKTLVVSGGVASNRYLNTVLRENLDERGFKDIQLKFPPPKFCIDNAAMIAWTGIEMYEAGFQTSLEAMALRKWSIDPRAQDGGILGADEWISAEGKNHQALTGMPTKRSRPNKFESPSE